jgi:hypothetical protein
MSPCLPVLTNRIYSTSSSYEPSALTSWAVGYSAVATSAEPSSHISRKLTKRREKPPLFKDNQQLEPGLSSSQNVVSYSAIPVDPDILPPPLYHDSDRLQPHRESITTPVFNEQPLPVPQWPRLPAWENGGDLINRWSRMDVSDDILIAELEKLRRNKRHYIQPDAGISDESKLTPPQHEEHSHVLDYSSDPHWPEEEDRRWKKARKAIFCCRELIRTELNYLEGLLQLENGEVRAAYRHYQPPLLTATIVVICPDNDTTTVCLDSLPTRFDCCIYRLVGSTAQQSYRLWGQQSFHRGGETLGDCFRSLV